jgi:hypothetical protein
MRWLQWMWKVCMACSLPLCGWAQSVAFINPGKVDEPYWHTVSESMRAAARSLGMGFEEQFAQREHVRSFDIARSIVARPASERPDYVIFTNDYGTGPELLRIFHGSGIRAFMAFSTLTAQEKSQHGGPRQQFNDWIGSLEPRAQDAGYLTAQALIAKGRAMRAQAADGKLHMVAIAGDRSTNSSIQRNEGMRQAVAQAPDVALVQTVYAGWARAKAQEQMQWLLQRHPETRLVWTGSDLMAFGAMDALTDQPGLQPGQGMWLSSVNTTAEALERLRSGQLAALAGGHFMAGAWALVMLYDYHHGRDFAKEGLELERPMFALLTPALARRYQERFGKGFGALDVRRYSKVINPKVQRYQFSFASLL